MKKLKEENVKRLPDYWLDISVQEDNLALDVSASDEPH